MRKLGSTGSSRLNWPKSAQLAVDIFEQSDWLKRVVCFVWLTAQILELWLAHESRIWLDDTSAQVAFFQSSNLIGCLKSQLSRVNFSETASWADRIRGEIQPLEPGEF